SRLLPIDMDIYRGMNSLNSTMDLAGAHVPILDLKENKIIQDFPRPSSLAVNEMGKSMSLDGLSELENSEYLASLKEKETLDAKHLRTKKIDNILDRNKPAYSKVY